MEARQGPFCGADAATRGCCEFPYFYLESVASEVNGRGETVWPASDDNRCALRVTPCCETNFHILGSFPPFCCTTLLKQWRR